MLVALDDNRKQWLQTIALSDPMGQSLLQLVEADALTAETLQPLYASLVREAIASERERYAQVGLKLVQAKTVICGGTFHPVDSRPIFYARAAKQAWRTAMGSAVLKGVAD